MRKDVNVIIQSGLCLAETSEFTSDCLEDITFIAFIQCLVLLQLTKMNVEAQRVERELRDKLAGASSKAACDADKARITELEKAEAELRLEVSKCVSKVSRCLSVLDCCYLNKLLLTLVINC